MDTRKKIVEAEAVPRDGRPLKVILGYFDPLYAEHVRRMRDLCSGGDKVVVAVADPEAPLLPWRARAELVAGLACVDYVVPAAGIEALGSATVVDERQGDCRRADALTARILARHKSA